MPRIRRDDTPTPTVAAYDLPDAAPVRTLDTAPQPTLSATRPTPKRSVSQILRERAEDAAVLLAAAEEVVFAIVAGHNPSAEERSVLVSLGITGQRLDAEVVRLTRVRNWRAKTGTVDDRDQARRDADSAAAALAHRGPEIEHQLADLQRELRTLQSAAEQANIVVVKQAAALDSLRSPELLPEQLVAEFNDHARAMQPLNAKLNTLRNEIGTTERLAGLDIKDPAVLAFAESAKLPCVVTKRWGQDGRPADDAPAPGGWLQTSIDAAGWQDYLRQRRADDAERQREIPTIEAELQTLAAKRESLLNHYVR